MKSVAYKIENTISKSSTGKIFFAEDFGKFGSSDNIRQILFRLEQQGRIERITQGIYLKPKTDTLLGMLYPTVEEVAKEIARRDRTRIAPTGVFALYQLGLTTQIPLNLVYLTDGAQRDIKVGNRKIKFKKTVPKSFAIKDPLLHLIVQAFKETGQKNISPSFLEKVQKSILKLDQEILENQLRFAPVWIQKEVINLHNQK
jgi:hypothetical protein